MLILGQLEIGVFLGRVSAAMIPGMITFTGLGYIVAIQRKSPLIG